MLNKYAKNTTTLFGVYLMILFLCLFSANQIAHAQDCDLPPGVSVSGANIVGPMTLNIGNGNTENVNLYVENILWPDGRCAAKVYRDTYGLWVQLYNKYMSKGITAKNIRLLVDSIRGLPGAGVYVKNNVGACGYDGFNRTIHCSQDPNPGMLYLMAHENMHGWEFFHFAKVGSAGINFLNAFTHYSNLVYRDYTQNPNNVRGTNWNLVYPYGGVPGVVNWVYGMQNQAEWGSEIFADWLHDTTVLSAWPYTKARQPAFAAYFDCLWKTDTQPTECARRLNLPLQIANRDPRTIPPSMVYFDVVVDGIKKSLSIDAVQSRAIWNVCFNNQTGTSNTQSDLDVMDTIVRSASPSLPGSPARSYLLGYADANHDNVYDWVCTYEGPGPIGLGNGNYLWNSANNKNGAISFIVSGKSGDDYAEYKQDPWHPVGTFVQPRFREWQGKFNSAFGAGRFGTDITGEWFGRFSAAIKKPPLPFFKPLTGRPFVLGRFSVNNGSNETLTHKYIGPAGNFGIPITLPPGSNLNFDPSYFATSHLIVDSSENVVLLYLMNGQNEQTLRITQADVDKARQNNLKTLPLMASLPNSTSAPDFSVSNRTSMALDLVWYDINGVPQVIDKLDPGVSKTLSATRFGAIYTLNNRYGVVSPFSVTQANNQALIANDSHIEFWKAQVGKSSTDQFCAVNGGICSFGGVRFVSYGVYPLYITKLAQNSIACTSEAFNDTAPDTKKACYVNAKPLTACAKENERCNFSGSKLVAYGTGNQFKWEVLKDGVDCNSTVFGDPAPNVVKACYLMDYTPFGLAQGSTFNAKAASRGQACLRKSANAIW